MQMTPSERQVSNPRATSIQAEKSPRPAIGRMRNRRGEGGRLRLEIIDQAGALLAETGDPTQLSLRSVARRVGIATTSVYLHFPDINHLILAVADQYFKELGEAQETAAAAATDPVEALLARCRAYCRFGVDRPGQYRLMFRTELAPGVDLNFAEVPGRSSFQSLVEAVSACRPFMLTDDADPPQRLASLIWALEHGLVSLQISRPRFPWAPIEGLIEDGVRRLLRVPAKAAQRGRRGQR